jgi:hypothetical protein
VSASQKSPDKPLMPRHAWQPFTPRGVAAFAGATFLRLFLAQLVVTIIVILALLWFLRVAWIPVVTEGIQHLPDRGFIRRGELNFDAESPQRLAENARLGFVVDLAGTGEAGQVAEVEVIFEKNRMVVRGPLGDWWRPYASDYVISFNRTELTPWWGARQWTILAVATVATVVWLFATWWALAFLFLPLTKVIAFFADRGVTWRGAWRMNAAALLPGACLVAGALVLHGFGAIDFFRFGLLYLLHFVTGLIFVITSPFFLPKLTPSAQTRNPFDTSSEMKPDASDQTPPNPFTGS